MIETIEVIAADGACTGARISGERGAALVFVHGVGSTAAIWDAQLDPFGERYRCAAIELRGNGTFADPEPSLVTRTGFADDVLAVADALGFERFTLVGCSLGGVVAFELWSRVSQRLAAMAIVGSFACYPNGQVYADGVKAAVTAAGSMRVFGEARAAKLGLPPARLHETVEQMACKSVPCYLAATQATWTGDYRAMLPSIAVPAWVTRGEHDAVAPAPLSEEIAAGIPGARLSTIPGAGHVANADAPEAFNAALEAFCVKIQ